MDKNIILRDGEIAVVIDNASIIMNVNTAFEIIEKLNARNTKDCNNDVLKNPNKTVKPDNVCLNDNTKDFKPNKNSIYFELFKDVPEIKTKSSVPGTLCKVPVLAFAFDAEKARIRNDLREGVGECIKRFDSMAAADCYYNVAPGTASTVANTWLPYWNSVGAMNPMIGGKKNYRFSSKYNGKNLRWYLNNHSYFDNVHKQVVIFRADALPQFILDRFFPKKY